MLGHEQRLMRRRRSLTASLRQRGHLKPPGPRRMNLIGPWTSQVASQVSAPAARASAVWASRWARGVASPCRRIQYRTVV